MDVEFSVASKRDELPLKRLFMSSFDDTIGFVNMFFRHRFLPENTETVRLGETIAGAAHLLSCRAFGRECVYIYALCVDPAFRGRGLGRALVGDIVKKAESRGEAVFLKPADERLFPFYEKAGLSPCGFVRETLIEPDLPAAELSSVSAAEYKALRDERFSEYNPVVWDDEAVRYALMQETFFGVSHFKTTIDGSDEIVLCGFDGSGPYIKETTARGDALYAVVSAVSVRYGGGSVKVTAPSNGGKESLVNCYGTGFPAPVYANLLLD